MTKFIAVSNRRGGVGKTTVTMMLAYGLSVARRQKVLVIDLDAQASTSIVLMGHEPRDGEFRSKAGKIRKRLGRPNADPKKIEAARRELAKGTGVLKTAKLVGLGTGTVQRLKRAS